MFEFDAGKLVIIAIVALIVIGPKELPRVMRHVGGALAKLQRMAVEFRGQFLDAMRESEIDDIKSEVKTLTDSSKTDFGIDPLGQIKAELTQALEAAEKSTSPPETGAVALVSAQNGEMAATHSVSPCTPDGSEMAGLSVAKPGDAPAAPEDKTAAAGAIDAEMRALADAIAAKIGEAAPGGAADEHVKAQDNR
jgi:sec-independent protein translocase protein TatB